MTSGTAGGKKAITVPTAPDKRLSGDRPRWIRTCDRPMAQRNDGASSGIAIEASKTRRPGNSYNADKRPAGIPATSDVSATAVATTKLRQIAVPNPPLNNRCAFRESVPQQWKSRAERYHEDNRERCAPPSSGLLQDAAGNHRLFFAAAFPQILRAESSSSFSASLP